MHSRMTDGLLHGNAVLSKGMVIAPVVVCCDTLQRALLVSAAFICITVPTVFIGSFCPKKLPYAARVVVYAMLSALLTIPVVLLCEYTAPDAYAAVCSVAGGIYLPLLSANSFIVLHAELYFYRFRRGEMLWKLVLHTLGFALAACLTALLRELLAYGSIAGHVVDMPLVMKGFAAPWGGFVMLGLLCALYRAAFAGRGDSQ